MLILSDDQRFDTMNVMPNVRHLIGDKGVRFENAFISNSLCCPSRASILTGLYSHGNGTYQNLGPFGGFASFDDSSTLATWLTPTYDTALFGKYLNGYMEPAHTTMYVPPGWDRWYGLAEDASKYYGFDQLISDGAGTPAIESFGHEPGDYSTNVLTRQAVKFIEVDHGGDPFFLYFAPNAPHGPVVPAPGDKRRSRSIRIERSPNFNELDMSDKPPHAADIPRLSANARERMDRRFREQKRALIGLDTAVGKLLDALRREKALANTMIVYMSDNGFLFGEHRWVWKGVPYEEAIHVPMYIRYDRMIETPGDRHDLVVNIDVAPTIMDAAGLVPPGPWDGSSLLPLLDGQGPSSWRTDFLLEHLDDGRGRHHVPTMCGIRSEDFAYMWYGRSGEELYDLSDDPYELHNLASDPDHASTLTAMRARVTQLCSPPPPDPQFQLPP